jgi:hypothetical protein
MDVNEKNVMDIDLFLSTLEDKVIYYYNEL